MSTMSRRAPLIAGLVVLGLVILLIWRAPGISSLLLGAFTVAYVAAPAVDRLDRRLPRGLATAIVMSAGLVLVLGFLLLFVPLFTNQYRILADRVPVLLDWVQGVVPRLESLLGITLPDTAADWSTRFREHLAESSGKIATTGGTLAGKMFGGMAGILGAIVNFTVLVPMLAFYLLLNYHDLWPAIRDLVPPRHVAKATAIKNDIDEVLGGFIRGQLTVALIIGAILAVGLTIVGIDGGIVIGLLGGLLNMIPLVGAIVSYSLAILMAILKFEGWGPILGVAIVLVVAGVLEQMVITPRIIGNKVGLPPLAVLLAVLGVAELFGFVGMLIAVPAAAMIKVLILHARRGYWASEGFGGRAPGAGGSSGGGGRGGGGSGARAPAREPRPRRPRRRFSKRPPQPPPPPQA